jgi:hypothetical protein
MADVTAGETFADTGAGAAVNATRLNNHVAGLVIIPAFFSGKSSATPLSGDYVLFLQNSSGQIRKATWSTALGLVALPAVDPVAGTAGSRTLGTGAQQAAPGNDTRFPASVTGVRKGAGAGSTDTAAGPADLAFPLFSASLTAGVVSLNCALYDSFTVLLDANATVTLATVPDNGTILVMTQQDGTGGRTLSFTTTQTKLWPNSTPISVTATAGAVDLWFFKRLGGNIFVSQLPNMG